MSGIKPMKRNVVEIVRYVEMANTSHTSGDLKFGHSRRQFGYGISQKNFHGRPMWMIGKRPAVITANTPKRMKCESAKGSIAPPPAVVDDAAPVDPAMPAEPVAEPAAPTAILLSDSGARVLQSPNALPGGSVSIAAITYTPDGGVQLSGLGAPGATVRLYLNNALRGEAVVTESGAWVSTLRGVLPGLYSLRADQVDGAGAVTSRFETPFQRESLEALAAVMKPQAVVAGPASAPPLTDAGVPAPPPAAALAVPDGPVNITVQPGFTLWQIARERFGDGVLYVKVYDANRDQIRDPDLIYPGQVFTIPGQ